MKRTPEDSESKPRNRWPRGGRVRPPQTGDGEKPARPAPPAKKKSSRSVFGPAGVDRPDMLTDAETVVLPTLARKPAASAEGSNPASATAPPRPTRVPMTTLAQPGLVSGRAAPAAAGAAAESTDADDEAVKAKGPAKAAAAAVEAEAEAAPAKAGTAAETEPTPAEAKATSVTAQAAPADAEATS
ncbi:MAG TPA: hypothetical protein VFE00_02100, partial [Arthrobacter sp.]|nr:hypothetical protein [Arthrobacter sp.]